jgi:hypothetical protein
MGLPILAAMVVIGVTAAVLAVHFTGGSANASLAGSDQTLSRFADDFPDENVLAIRFTSNAETAFLELEGQRTGIVQVFGDKFLTRIVSPHDVARIDTPQRTVISIRLHDFTWGGGEFRFADEAAAGAVLQALNPRTTRKMLESLPDGDL